MNIPSHIDTKPELETYLLQHALKTHGYDPGILDGIRGHKTEAALAYAWKDHRRTEPTATIPQYAIAAQEHIGLTEIPGTKSNPTILAWIKSFFPSTTDDSTTAWCAIFINQMLAKCGIAGTGKATARSFLDWGTKITEPRKGDIVILWRGSPTSWQGHVGIYWGEATDSYIHVLGGNQNNKVSIATYPETRVLGYRRAKP